MEALRDRRNELFLKNKTAITFIVELMLQVETVIVFKDNTEKELYEEIMASFYKELQYITEVDDINWKIDKYNGLINDLSAFSDSLKVKFKS